MRQVYGIFWRIFFGKIVAVLLLVPGTPAWAAEGHASEQKPLQVNGQSRNLNMMLVLRSDRDKIKFVKVRENYRDEILENTNEEN